MFGWFKKKPKPQQSAAETIAGLRNMILQIKPDQVGVPPNGSQPVAFGVLLEFALSGSAVTLVSLADRTTSLYFGNGGGILGTGSYEAVGNATLNFIATAQGFIPQMKPTTTYPTATNGVMIFYVLTTHGIFTATAPESELTSDRHRLSPLFNQANEVITNARIISEQQQSQQ